MTMDSNILIFLGRLHPLVVHLPIGFFVMLGALEVVGSARRFQHVRTATGPIVLLSAIAGVAAAACGWLLGNSGGYEEQLLEWHERTGIAIAVGGVLSAVLFRLNMKQLYRGCLILTLAVLAVTSHLGGSLTHGKDYLARYAPGSLAVLLGGTAQPAPGSDPTVSLGDREVFSATVQPVFDKYCISCHGAEKSKARLRLDSHAAILLGSENGPVMKPGVPAESELLAKIRLPLEHDDHMPPEGKPQPGADDITLIEWWIQAGAPTGSKLAELAPPATVMKVLEGRFASAKTAAVTKPAPVASPRPLVEVQPLMDQLVEELDIALGPLAQGEPWLQCNASIAGQRFGDAELARLGPLAKNLRWLDLAGTAVTDAGLTGLPAMHHLTKLHLERTAITDAGLTSLRSLAELEYLNLYGTVITDTGLEALKSLPKLRRLFLWQTKVTSDAAKAFAETRLDRGQIVQWEREIEELQARIRAHQMQVNMGADTGPLPATAASPTPPSPAVSNQVCPVSGKPVDATKTTLHEGRLIAFCCDNCKGKFEANPKPFLSKLGEKPASDDGDGSNP